MTVELPLATRLRFGIMVSAFDGSQARRTIETVLRLKLDSVWAGDHVAFTGPISDPLTQLTYMAALAPQLLFGTSVYLLPLRSPVPVAKMVATVDRMLGGGNFIFGVGGGGEFPREYQACGVPLRQRGGRLDESISLLRRLWTEPRVAHAGKYLQFDEIKLEPKPLSPGGPPIWVGGRSEAALRRAARLGDGWMPYVITPKRMHEGLEFISAEAQRAGRTIERFGTAALLFFNIDESYESSLETTAALLSKRYAMDFREPARRYCALGRPQEVAAKLQEFIEAGARDLIFDAVAPSGQGNAQLERLASEVLPLLRKG